MPRCPYASAQVERAYKAAQSVLPEESHVSPPRSSLQSKFSRAIGSFNPRAMEFVPSFLRSEGSIVASEGNGTALENVNEAPAPAGESSSYFFLFH